MGGGGGDDDATILETPPYVIAIVFCFFLVVSLGFEKILHLLRHALEKRGKHGLVGAMNNMQNELMCLGVATLILILFQGQITSVCVSATTYTKTWLDFVGSCSCCLTRTKGVGACYLANKGCISNSALQTCCDQNPGVTRADAPGLNCNLEDIPEEYVQPGTKDRYALDVDTGEIYSNGTSRRRLQQSQTMRALLGGGDGKNLASVQCPDGSEIVISNQINCVGRIRTGAEECGYNTNNRPAIGPTALDQIHIFIFIIAMVHIATGVALIVFSTLRVHFWRRWKDHEDDNVKMVQGAVDSHSTTIHSIATAGKLESQLEEEAVEISDKSRSTTRSLHPTQLPSTFEIERQKKWRGRAEKLVGFRARIWELLACLWRQFLPNVVTKEEFSLMRSAFLLTHHVQSTSNFRYVDYMRNAMEDDFAHVVGLSLSMWCFIIVFVLLSTAIGWCIWVFVIFSGALLAVVNTKLVWIVRYATRGGHVHRLKPGIFWLNRPWLMLPIIKFLVFFVSYVYANAIFFATQFGSKSCFFSSAGFQGQPVPWWVIMMVNTIFLASLSLLTLPLYAVTVQMGGDYKSHLLPVDVLENAQRVQSLQVSDKKGFRKLLSTWIPKERDVARAFASDSSKTLVQSAVN